MSRTLAIALVSLLAACDRPPSSSASTPRSEASATITIEHVERTTAGASLEAPLPLLVLLHGRGSSPERFVAQFESLDVPMRLLALRAPIEEHDGRAWFTFRDGGAHAVSDLAALVEPAMRVIEANRATRLTRGRPIVLGFSQGGMLAYALALARPEAFSLVLPVSAIVLGPAPAHVSSELPIAAFHGTEDEVIPIGAHRHDVDALAAAGARVTLTSVDGATHWIGDSMRAAIFERLRSSTP